MVEKYHNVVTGKNQIPLPYRLPVLKETIERLEKEYSILSMLFDSGDTTLLNFGGVIISLKKEYERRRKI